MLHRTIRIRICYSVFDARLLSALFLVPSLTSAETSVFRCTNPAGEVEFRQTACAPAATEKTLTIRDRTTGWVPPQPPDSISAAGKSGGSRKTPGVAHDKAESRQIERCWKKRRQLDTINSELRTGYKAAKGSKLRRRRDEHEDYLDRFCAGR